jgi:tagaturonate epimerase
MQLTTLGYLSLKSNNRKNIMMKLGKYSLGTGDRFGKQGIAQLQAIAEAKKLGVEISIIWNKSYREHIIIHTDPASVRKEADSSVQATGWTGDYHVDADHINIESVDLFIDTSDFFTLDVADYTGMPAAQVDIEKFVAKYLPLCGNLTIPGIEISLEITENKIRHAAERYLLAVQKAGKIYRKIEAAKGIGNFITEVSMDETDIPQTPEELLFILAAISDEEIPAQTIAPKFTGRFNKGVDYIGDLKKFEQEFNEDICIISYAVNHFDLPANLKLSIHSGSDKFSIYPIMGEAIRKHDAGLHVKTAGTTWLEEIIGLAESGSEGISLAKEIYRDSLNRYDELTGPYASVIDIDKKALPSPEEFDQWTGDMITEAVRHDLNNPAYNLHIRQLLHVGYKVAAEMGTRYLDALKRHQEVIGKNVTENLWERHIKRIFFNNLQQK